MSTSNPRDSNASAQALMRLILGTVLASGVVLSVGGAIGWGLRSGLGVAIGASLAAANLWSLQKIGRGFLDEPRRRALWGIAGLVKFLAVAGALWLLISRHFVDGVPLIVGYAALPIGITLGSLVGLRLAEGS